MPTTSPPSFFFALSMGTALVLCCSSPAGFSANSGSPSCSVVPRHRGSASWRSERRSRRGRVPLRSSPGSSGGAGSTWEALVNTIRPTAGTASALLTGVPATRNHGRRRGRPRRPANRRTSRALRRGSRRLCACSRFISASGRLPCPRRGPARRTSHDLRHPGRPAGCDPHCRRSRARCTPGPPHRPRGHRATARGERPRRPRLPESSFASAEACRKTTRVVRAGCPQRRSAGWMRGRRRSRGRAAIRYRPIGPPGRSSGSGPRRRRPAAPSPHDGEVSVRALAAAILFERGARPVRARRGRALAGSVGSRGRIRRDRHRRR